MRPVECDDGDGTMMAMASQGKVMDSHGEDVSKCEQRRAYDRLIINRSELS